MSCRHTLESNLRANACEIDITQVFAIGIDVVGHKSHCWIQVPVDAERNVLQFAVHRLGVSQIKPIVTSGDFPCPLAATGSQYTSSISIGTGELPFKAGDEVGVWLTTSDPFHPNRSVRAVLLGMFR